MPTASDIRVAALATTPVKGSRLLERTELYLGPHGERDNRRFYLVDERGRMVNGKQVGALQSVVADYDHAQRRLTLRFADGATVTDVVRGGATIQTGFFSRPAAATLVLGPWSSALSEIAGRQLRLVETGDTRIGADRGRAGAVSLISRASLDDLARRLGVPQLDARRFRMLIEIEGAGAYEEDGWVGASVRVGDALIRPRGHVGRCLITSRDPETGEADLPTLEVLGSYRHGAATTEPLSLGIYGEVHEPGTVRLGDPVTVVGRGSP